MKKMSRWALAPLVGLLAASGAGAADFSPEIQFGLSDTKVKANPAMTVAVEQDEGEEELAHVTLSIPKGFVLPPDEAIADGSVLGEGEINIHVGPGCRPDFPVKEADTNLNLPASLEEADRTDEQSDRGVYAVWVLDISGVTRINLEVTGSAKKGWKLDGDIPPNDNTCPPFSFDLAINQESADGVPIIVNPPKPGKAVFRATFTSLGEGLVVDLKQVIKITK